MLEIRPSCEYCHRPLPADSAEAMICSYECTFCRDCVEDTLHNVCPNCGGGFQVRPVRVKTAWRKGVSLGNQPGSDKPVHQSIDPAQHELFAEPIRAIPPEQR